MTSLFEKKRTIDVINPATEQVIRSVTVSHQIEKDYQRAKTGQKKWAKRPLPERMACIVKFQQALETKKDDLALILTQETGKPLWQSYNELKGACTRIQFFLEHVENYSKSEIMTEKDHLTEKIAYEPLGVIGNISAWNYPYLVGINVFIPALLTGNAVLYKPSEYALLTGLEIETLLQESGIPKEVFITIVGDKNEGEQLLELPLDGYFFTGSYPTGKYIYEKVAKKMVPCQMELGGKDAVYVSEHNTNLGKVAQNLCEGVFYNNGQSCCAVERIYVHTSLYAQFVALFNDFAKSWIVGDPMDASTMLGPLTRKAQKAVLEDQIKDAVAKGGHLLQFHTDTQLSSAYYFPPSILTNVNHKMKIMKEESFGPVIGIQEVDNLEEAIFLIKDSTYGLTAGIYTENQNEAGTFGEEMDTGSVYVNCCDRVSPYLPWGGRKHSGLGLTLSYHGLRAFLKTKAYHWKQGL